MDKKLSYESIKPHLQVLRYFGCYQIDQSCTKIQKCGHRIYMTFVLFLLVLYAVQEFAHCTEVINEPDKVIDTVFLMLTYSVAIYKKQVFWMHQDKIEEILDILRGPLFNQNEVGHRGPLMDRERESRLLLRAFNVTALSTCLLWVVYPAILFATNKPFELTIWLPFDPNTSPQFFYALVYAWAQTSLLALGNTTMDAFITFFFALSKTQLSILRYDLKHIVKKCEEESKATSQTFSEVFNRCFRNIMMHYDQIVYVCKQVQNIFGGVTLYLFLVNTWVICTSAYVMAKLSPLSVKFSSMCLYMICILTEICLYCYYGNEVTVETEHLVDSLFGMDWYKLPVKQRYNVIMFMERLKRPVVPMAGAFLPLSNKTFISILRNSYSFYALLKNSG